jgi:hypothetical protein
MRRRTREGLKPAEIQGLQGVKMVSAEGIESTLKRIFNDMQVSG